MPDVLITENIAGPAVDQLTDDFTVLVDPDLWRDPLRLGDQLHTARALIVRNQTQVSAELIAQAPRLEVIARAGAGLDNVDCASAAQAGIVVTYAPKENSLSVAELTIGLMLCLARRLPAADADTRSGNWNRQRFTGRELSSQTLGIVGLGRIGRLVARRAAAFGMEVIAHDAYLQQQADAPQLDWPLVSLEELLERADFVTCHVPLSDDTRGLFGPARFRAMKRSAMFINTSRGEIVDEGALAEALQQGQLAAAALDVRTSEPPGPSPLNDLDNVVLTPHIAAFTCEAQRRVVEAVCRDVTSVLRGQAACNCIGIARPSRHGQ